MMTRRLIFIVLTGLLALGQPAARAEHHGRGGDDDEHSDGEGSSRGGRQTGRREKGDSELEDVMEEMNGAFRKLRRQVEDKAQNPSSLTLAGTLYRLAQRAAQMTPRMIVHAPDKDRPGLLANYRDQMKELVATVADLQVALRAGKNAQAAGIIDDLRDLEKAGHHKFRTEGEH
jgi:hypothetical protein